MDFNGHALEALEVGAILLSFKKKRNQSVKQIFSLLFVVSKVDSASRFFAYYYFGILSIKGPCEKRLNAQ